MKLNNKMSIILTDKSVRDHHQQIKIKNGVVTVISKFGSNIVCKYNFNINEWRDAKYNPSANTEYNYRKLIAKKFKDAAHLDISPEGESITELIIDSQIRGIKKTLMKLNKKK